MATNEYTKLKERADRAARKAKGTVPLSRIRVSIALYRSLVEMCEKHGCTMSEAMKWALEEGVKVFGARVQRPRLNITRAMPEFNDEALRIGDDSVKALLKRARQSRAAGTNTVVIEEEPSDIERFIKAAVDSGALSAIPADVLLPSTGPEAPEPEEEPIEQE